MWTDLRKAGGQAARARSGPVGSGPSKPTRSSKSESGRIAAGHFVMQNGIEKRGAARVALERPAKVFHLGSQRYLGARTRDISGAGVLLCVEGARRLRVGDRVEVMVQWGRRALLS